MVLYYPDLVRFDPMRPLDWRWERAQSLVAAGSRFRRDRDDEDTGRAVRYLRAVRRLHTADEPIGELKVKPDLLDNHRAYQLHAAASPQTTVVQARLLARQGPDEIGALVSLTPAAVKAYEAVFFNVRQRLEAKVYIAKLAVGWTSAMAVAGCGVDVVSRSIAYYGGPFALEVAIPVLLPQAARWCPTMAPIAADSTLAAKVRQLAGILMMPIRNGKDAMKLMRLNIRLMETTQLAGAGENVSLTGVFHQLVAETVSELSQECFQPLPKPPRDCGDVRSGAVGGAEDREVA